MEDTIGETLEETCLKKMEREEAEETSKGLQKEPVEESLVRASEGERMKKPSMAPSKSLEE